MCGSSETGSRSGSKSEIALCGCVLKGLTAPLNLHRKLNETPARPVLTARAEGGNRSTCSISVGV